MDNRPKFLLCIKYDFKIVIRNRQLGGLPMQTKDCSVCTAKVVVAQSSLEMLERYPETKIICDGCAEAKIRSDGEPHYTATRGQLKEAWSILAKIKAANN